MPIYLEPGQRYPVVLDSDANKPEGERPTFYAKSQSMRGQQRIAEVLDRLTDEPGVSVEQLFDDAVQTLSGILVGWERMVSPETGEPIPYSPEALADVLTYTEARELMGKVMFNQHLRPDEKKDSESPA